MARHDAARQNRDCRNPQRHDEQAGEQKRPRREPPGGARRNKGARAAASESPPEPSAANSARIGTIGTRKTREVEEEHDGDHVAEDQDVERQQRAPPNRRRDRGDCREGREAASVPNVANRCSRIGSQGAACRHPPAAGVPAGGRVTFEQAQERRETAAITS